MSSPSPSPSIHFGEYTADLEGRQLFRSGSKVKLQGQPFEILALLLERSGRMVSRDDLRQRLWPSDTFVDFEHGLNAAVNRLRDALDDSADTPRYIETVPKRGYRFIGQLEGTDAAPRMHAAQHRLWIGLGAALGTIAVLFTLNVAGLRDWTFGSTRKPIQSIAVLPLANLSGDPEQDYFSDGMTDELITILGRVSALRVISRTSIVRYKGTKKPLQEIARELNVDAVVEGTVLRSGNHVRITANLLHAPTDRQLWSESYDRELRDMLAVQNEVARAIVGEIRMKLTPQQETRLATARPLNPEAYEDYLRGRYFYDRWPYGLEKAIGYFQRSIEKDATFAPAYARSAEALNSMGFFVPPREVFPKSKAALTRALELNQDLPEAYVAVGRFKDLYERDWEGAEQAFRRALEIDPSNAFARSCYAMHLTAFGPFDQAIGQARQAIELDPVGLLDNAIAAWVYLQFRQYDDAIAQYTKTLELDPNYSLAREQRAWCLILKGDYAHAFAEYQTMGMSADDPFLGYLFAVSGRREDALRTARKLERLSKTRYVSPFDAAALYAGLRQKDRAFYWLNRAYDERDARMMLLKVNPFFDALRSDPRFQDLLRRMNFPPTKHN